MNNDIDIKELLKRIELLEAAVFYTPAGDLPESRFGETKKPVRKKISEKKIRDYVNKNPNISKTELVFLCSKLGLKASSVSPKQDIIDLLLTGIGVQEEPLKDIKNKTETYIAENNIAISTVKCDMDCQNCYESRVILCQMNNKDKINRYFDQ